MLMDAERNRNRLTSAGLLRADGEIAMGLLVRLLNPKTARAFYDWMMGIRVELSLKVGDAGIGEAAYRGGA